MSSYPTLYVFAVGLAPGAAAYLEAAALAEGVERDAAVFADVLALSRKTIVREVDALREKLTAIGALPKKEGAT